MTETDHSSLRTIDAREAFMQRALREGSAATTLQELLGYIDFNQEQLEAAGFEPDEAQKTAAETVFSGVSNFLRQHGHTADLDRVQSVDGVIRYAHDIRDRDFPKHHEDPLIAAFYSSLEGHLNKRMPGDRFDAFGGYTQV